VASFAAIAAVSRTLQALLLDRLIAPAEVTLAPPDITPEGVSGAHVNLYLVHVLENATLKNQEVPGVGYPAAYGRPPLWLGLRYLLTTHSAIETQITADLNAQTLLGDAMRIFHDFGPRLDSLKMVRAVAGKVVGDPVLDPELTGEFERVKIVLHPASLDDLTKLWSALGESSFRRSVLYEVEVVQIETIEPRVRPRPVEKRRILASVQRRPVIRDAYVTPGPTAPIGERRARIGDEITIEAEGTQATRLYVRLGGLDAIRVPTPGDGIIRIRLPDDVYAPDLDHPAPLPVRPIAPTQQLQPGPLSIEVIAVHPVEGVEGALGRGTAISEERQFGSNLALLQLVPDLASSLPPSGGVTGLLTLKGTRLWQPAARRNEVVIGDATIEIRPPRGADPWAAPTPTQIQVPLADVGAFLPVQGLGDPPYPVAVQIDGARSRAGFSYTRTL
jgi:hypothetical protein